MPLGPRVVQVVSGARSSRRRRSVLALGCVVGVLAVAAQPGRLTPEPASALVSAGGMVLIDDGSRLDPLCGDPTVDEARLVALSGTRDVNLGRVGVVHPDPSGRRLAIGRRSGLLAVIDLLSGRVHKLGTADAVKWSRDGRALLAQSSDERWLVAIGDRAVDLHELVALDLAPDGGAVVGLEQHRHGHLVDQPTLAVAEHGWRTERLPFGSHEVPQDAAWSPDSHALAYGDVAPNGHDYVLRIVERTSRHVRTVRFAADDPYGPLWSPDGRLLAVLDKERRRIVVVDGRSGAWHAVPVPDVASQFDWRDPRHLSISPGGGLALISARNGQVAWRTRHRAVAWSPDGRRLLAVSTGWAIVSRVGADTRMVRYRGRVLPDNPTVTEQGIWLDDREVVVSSERGLYLVEAATGKASLVRAARGDHVFSPKAVVYPSPAGLRLLHDLAARSRASDCP
jgi:hypothetical protein